MTLSKLSVDKLTKYQEFYKKNPWNSRKFVDIAEKQGLDRKEASKFLKKEVVHDQLKPEQRFIPIVSKTPGGWQMDTFINDKVANGLNYLMFININTRKAHAYPMVGKGTSQVLQALDKFVEKVIIKKVVHPIQQNVYNKYSFSDFAKSKPEQK